MIIVETRQQLGITETKPLHKNGEVEERRYMEHLNPRDRLLLQTVLNHIGSASRDSKFHVLAVGSSTDLQSPQYNDIDLLICSDDPKKRLEFFRQIHKRLQDDEKLLVLQRFSGGSAPIIRDPHIHSKLLVFPVNTGSDTPKQIDLTFLSEYGGSFEDALLLHRQDGLSFSQLKSG